MRTRDEIVEFLLDQTSKYRVSYHDSRKEYEQLADEILIKHVLGEELTLHQLDALGILVHTHNMNDIISLKGWFDED